MKHLNFGNDYYAKIIVLRYKKILNDDEDT
jgi:hypothetical protein